MWYRATSYVLTLAAFLLVTLACTIGYRIVDQVHRAPPLNVAQSGPTEIPQKPLGFTNPACFGNCALDEFYRQHPDLKGRLAPVLESVLKVKLDDLLKQRLNHRGLIRKAKMGDCLRTADRKQGPCRNIAQGPTD